MEKNWFEMPDIRKRRFDAAVWIPLRANLEEKSGKWGHLGHKSSVFAAASLAVPLRKRAAANDMGWRSLNLMHDHQGYANGTRYIPADEYDDKELKGSVPLVMSQSGNSAEPATWHLHPDFVITLKLKREENVWVAMDEGYIEVARLKLDGRNHPELLEVRAEHLKDYLCARRMVLRLSWYRERVEVVESEPDFKWPKPDRVYKDGERWEGRITAIHEGGHPFGESMSVAHLTRPNIDFEEDVPKVGISDDIKTSSFTRKLSENRKLYRVSGEVWRAEWVEPGTRSTRIRDDEPDPPVSFIVDASGKRQSAKTLVDSGIWLWFKPDVVPALIGIRGGSLDWYTRETGGVRGSPDSRVHFGVNSLGLVNALAKDVAMLPEWLQHIWAGFNVSPDGKVSAELFAAQGMGIPASTQSPELFLPPMTEALNNAFKARFGSPLLRAHSDPTSAFTSCHRFKALSESGLYGLAKELVRVVVEHIDAGALKRIVTPPEGEKWGSLKLLEKVLATVIDEKAAYALLSPLHGIYSLRLADAHVPSKSELDEAYKLSRVDRSLPFVMQGRDLLRTCVTCLRKITEAVK